MSKVLFVLLVVTELQVVRVTTFSLSISPDHLRVTQYPQSVSFTCSTDVALAGCQFKWWDGRRNEAGPLLELSQLSQSQADPAQLNHYEQSGYSYSGRGLWAGDCGVSLQVQGPKDWIVACRVRSESRGWKYAWADLYAHDRAHLPHNQTTQREVVVLPGGEARFMLKAGEPLTWCRFYMPGVSGEIDFNQGAESEDSTGRHLYLGAGLQSGECGLALRNITEEDNRPVWGSIDTPTGKTDERPSALIVARRPTEPTLSLVYTSNQVTATCVVNESRPVANMSWVWGEEVISQNDIEDTHSGTQGEWRWPWKLASIKQTVTLQLQPQHNGTDLKCVVSHFTLDQSLVARQPVSFTAGVASYSLVMSPKHQHVYQSQQSVTFICTAANVSLVGCQFSWWDFDTGAGPLVELSRGSESQRNPACLNSRISHYKYSGDGLWEGDCGITMKVQGLKTWIVTCRVRPQIGDWKYAWAELYADEWTPLTNTVTTPREAVVVPGGEARFMIQGQGPLLQCRFNLPGVSGAVYFNDGARSNSSTGRHRYLGAGPQSGECGLALSNVSEADNGLVRVYMRAPNWKEHIRFVVLIVERRPTAPTLVLSYNMTDLTATCEVKNGRPYANITWYIGDNIIHRGKDDAPHDEWRWPWMTGAIKQTLRRQLNTQYQGKVLRCVVTHATLEQPLEDRELISFTG